MIKIALNTNIEDMMNRLGEDLLYGKRAAMQRVVSVARGLVILEEPVVTSNMVNATTDEVSADGNTGRVFITDAAPYAEYVYRGTGIYGPHGRPIVPASKKALYGPGLAHPFRSVKGQRPNPFIDRAAEKLDAGAEYEKGMSDWLKQRGQI